MPEGYVYPITPNNVNVGPTHHQQMILGGSNHSQLYPAMPMPYPVTSGGQYGYPYSIPNNNGGMGGAQNPWPTGYSQTSSSTNQNQSQSQPANAAHLNQQPNEDLPPPYHVAVGATTSHPH